ncbi:MAG TPA: allantoate amidohydrolase [Vicinamibacterales bacterium]
MPADRACDVIGWCRALARHSEEPGFTTRTFLSAPMRAVHADLSAWMARAGMDVRVDAAGNLRGVYPGSSPDAATLFIGSHLDTVPHAGAFDGVLGVVIGIMLVDMLEGRRLPFSIEVVGFSEEEGVRFGVPFIGSRALAGTLDEDLLGRRDAAGIRVSDAIREFGLDPSRLGAARAADRAIGYFELHIEQGPLLEALELPLGVVDAIAGQSRVDVAFTGTSGHAGTTPMHARRDALAGAAEWIGHVEREAAGTRGLVATVGRIDALPGATNVIAGTCRASLDIRHADDGIRIAARNRLGDAAREMASRRGLTLDWDVRLDQAAVKMNRRLAAMLTRAVERTGMRAVALTSGAGHDAMIVAGRMPAAMLMLRSPGGISHHPSESVLDDDVAAALAAGGAFLEELARTARD